MPFPPQLYLIGTQKGGTSYLASLIGQHPEICLAEPKEPQFYTSHWDKGLDWYRGRFADPDAPVLLDASTSYTASPLPSIDPPDAFESSKLAGIPARDLTDDEAKRWPAAAGARFYEKSTAPTSTRKPKSKPRADEAPAEAVEA